ncbi:MAG TPA: IucA/IucC family protein [Solirubrobacteraceae bacterium]|nr:IucA/IucC family protein [Solirubrobacteraceae bacterium]
MHSQDDLKDWAWMKVREWPRTPGFDAAVSAVTEAVLNCYTREGGDWRPLPASTLPELAAEGDEYIAVLPFPEDRTAVLAGIRHLSPTHRHRFRTPAQIAMAGGEPWAISLETLMSMLADELGETHAGPEMTARHLRGPDPTLLLSRIRQSVNAIGTVLDARADEVDELWNAEPVRFIDAEQAGLLGHMAHPTTLSRWGMEPDDIAAYAPERQPRFRLQWLAVDPSLIEQNSATGTSAAELTERLLRDDAAVDGAALDAALADLGERVLLPVHPWEFAHLRGRAPVSALLEEGLIVDLGELGSPVTPTTSMRTVYNGDWPWQLTFSLHAHMTDEMRLTPIAEMEAAVTAARELEAQAAAAGEAAPQLTLLQDPAYLAVSREGTPVAGLSVQLRENRWSADSETDVSAVEVLVQDHPFGGSSRLAQIVARLAERSGRLAEDVAREWFARYAEIAVLPLLHLRAQLGLSLRSDQQNTLIELEDGWPARCVLRETHGSPQQAAHDDIAAAGPGIGEGPFLDNALSVINALGVAGLVEEIVLLADLKALLERERAAAEETTPLLDRLLDDATWPCRANMRTRMHNDIDRYVQIPNPLHGVRN